MLATLLLTALLAGSAPGETGAPAPLAPPAVVTPPADPAPLAPPAVVTPPAKRNVVFAVLGVGTPIGWYGYQGEHRFGPSFELSAGFGMGESAAVSHKNPSLGDVVQWAVMPRYRTGTGRDVVSVGVGASGGQYGGSDSGGASFNCSDIPGCRYRTTYVLWANAEVGFEHLADAGYVTRFFAGAALGCTAESCATSVNGHDLLLPYVGMGIGYPF